MISQSAGITLRFSEACAIVGETVMPSSGSTSSPASGETARAARERVAGGRHRAEHRREERLDLGHAAAARP